MSFFTKASPKCCDKRGPAFPHRSARQPISIYLLEVTEAKLPDVKLKSWVLLNPDLPKKLEKIPEVFAIPSTMVAVLVIQEGHLSVVTFEGRDYTMQGSLTMKGWATDTIVNGFSEIIRCVRATWCTSTFEDATWAFYRVTRRGKQSIDRKTREWINSQVAQALNK